MVVSLWVAMSYSRICSDVAAAGVSLTSLTIGDQLRGWWRKANAVMNQALEDVALAERARRRMWIE